VARPTVGTNPAVHCSNGIERGGGGTVAEAEHTRSTDAVICVDGLVDEHEELAAHLEQDDTDPQLEQLVSHKIVHGPKSVSVGMIKPSGTEASNINNNKNKNKINS
jgi:hypothetical protein